MWHPWVSALTGYRAGHFPAWEQPPGNLHTSKLLPLSNPKTLVHFVQSWLALCHSVGSLLPCGRDVQWEIPVPSLPYGFKLFPPGNFPYGNSREIPEIREFPELREFPVLRESQEFPSHGKFPFLSAHISDFQSVFCVRKLVL